jgi:hypothetical protein
MAILAAVQMRARIWTSGGVQVLIVGVHVPRCLSLTQLSVRSTWSRHRARLIGDGFAPCTHTLAE